MPVWVGFTVILKLVGVPLQLLAVGVTETVEIIGEVVEFMALNEAIFPVPFAANPVFELLFVQP